jgi:hypothetical protein
MRQENLITGGSADTGPLRFLHCDPHSGEFRLDSGAIIQLGILCCPATRAFEVLLEILVRGRLATL